MSYEDELRGLRQAIDGPTVGHPTKAMELAELERLINRYPDEAREIWARIAGT